MSNATLFPTLYTGSNGRDLVIDYKAGLAASSKVYPESDTYEVLGQLYVPRIYGKDLTAFELGSSGKVAMTLQDIHALDFDRNATTSTVSLSTLAGDKLLLTLDNSNAASIQLGDSNVVLTAGGSIVGTGSDIAFAAASNVSVTASNTISGYAGNHIIWGAGSNLSLGAGSNITLAASNDFTATAGSNIALAATSNVTVTASNDVSISALSDVFLTATSNVAVTASNTISLVAGSNVELIAASDVQVTATQSITTTAGSNYAVTAASNVTITASNGDMTMAAPNGTFAIVASNVSFGLGGGDFALSSGSNSLAFTGSNATLTSGGNLMLNGDVQAMVRSGSNYMAITPSNAVFYTREGDIDIAAATATGAGEARVSFGNSNTRTLSLESTSENGSNVSMLQLSGCNVTALASSNYQLFVGTTTITGAPAFELSSAAANTVSTQHQWYLGTGASEPTLRLYKDASGDPIMQLKGRLDIQGEINTILSTELKVSDKTITLAANEDGAQVYDGVNSAAGLLVNGIPTAPGFSNAPDALDADDMTSRYYEKSMLWVHGSEGGIDKLGTSNGVNYSTGVVSESRWEIRGGHLELTIPKAMSDGKVRDVTFGLRVNERSELELFKRSWENGAYKARRLTRWGHGNGML